MVSLELTLWARGWSAVSTLDAVVPSDRHIETAALPYDQIPQPASFWRRWRVFAVDPVVHPRILISLGALCLVVALVINVVAPDSMILIPFGSSAIALPLVGTGLFAVRWLRRRWDGRTSRGVSPPA